VLPDLTSTARVLAAVTGNAVTESTVPGTRMTAAGPQDPDHPQDPDGPDGRKDAARW
jgi:hypothetical protein